MGEGWIGGETEDALVLTVYHQAENGASFISHFIARRATARGGGELVL